MTNDRTTFDGIILYQLCNFRLTTWLGIFEGSKALPLVEGDPPSVTVWAGSTSTLHEPSKTETNIRWNFSAHTEQFTHGLKNSLTTQLETVAVNDYSISFSIN